MTISSSSSGGLISAATRFLTRQKRAGGESTSTSSPFTVEHRERQAKFQLRWDYYLGDQRLPLKKRADEKDANVIESFTTVIVNNSVNFLFGGGLNFEIGELEHERKSADEQTIYDFWKPKIGWNSAEFLEKLGQSGAITGTPIVRMYTKPDEKDGEILLRVYDSSLVDLITDPTDAETVIEYHLFWKDAKAWNRHRIVQNDSGLWDIAEERFGSEDGWETVEITPWPYEFPPVFYCQNIPLAHSIWGISDADHASLNDTINEMSTDINKILHYHASPVTVAYGVSGTQLQGMKLEMGAGRIIPAPAYSADGKLPRFENLEMQSDLSASAMYKQSVVDTYNDIVGNVKVGREEVSLGALSGFAIQLLYLPLLQKTARKQQSYGGMLAQINHAILRLRGVKEPPYVQTLFGSSLPRNLPEMVGVADVLSNKTDLAGALLFAGFTDEEIAALVKTSPIAVEQ